MNSTSGSLARNQNGCSIVDLNDRADAVFEYLFAYPAGTNVAEKVG